MTCNHVSKNKADALGLKNLFGLNTPFVNEALAQDQVCLCSIELSLLVSCLKKPRNMVFGSLQPS